MNTTAEEAFIQSLVHKAQSAQGKHGNPGDARRDLAELRGILRGQPWDFYRAGRHIVPALDDANVRQGDDFREQCFYQVAGLFALAYREVPHRQGGSFGAALRLLRPTDKTRRGSLDGRFLALLNCGPDQLWYHLRQMIALLQSSKEHTALDWAILLRDIQYWEANERPIQMKWARDYYRDNTNTLATSPAEDKKTEDEGVDDEN